MAYMSLGSCCESCANDGPCASGLGASTPLLESPGKAAAAGAITGATVGLVAGPFGALIGGAIGAGAGAGAGFFLGKKAKKQKKKARNKLQAQQQALDEEQRGIDTARVSAAKAKADQFRSLWSKAQVVAKNAAYRAAFLTARQTQPDARAVLDSLANEAVEIGRLAESITIDDPEAGNKLLTLTNQASEIITTLDGIAKDSGLGSMPRSRSSLSGLGDISPALGPWLKSVRATNRVISGLPAGQLNLDGLADSRISQNKADATQTLLVGLFVAGLAYTYLRSE